MDIQDYSALARLVCKYGSLIDEDEKALRKALSIVLKNIEQDMIENYGVKVYHHFKNRED